MIVKETSGPMQPFRRSDGVDHSTKDGPVDAGLQHTSDKAGSALVRRRHEQAPCLKKSRSAAARRGRRCLLSKMLAHAHRRKSILSEQPLRPLVGHGMDHKTTGAAAPPTVCPTHQSSQASDALMASDVSFDCAASGLGTKIATLDTSHRANSRDEVQRPDLPGTWPVSLIFPIPRPTAARVGRLVGSRSYLE